MLIDLHEDTLPGSGSEVYIGIAHMTDKEDYVLLIRGETWMDAEQTLYNEILTMEGFENNLDEGRKFLNLESLIMIGNVVTLTPGTLTGTLEAGTE